MKLKTLVPALLVLAAMPFAHAAVTITSPADYATVATLPDALKTYNTASSTYQYTTYSTASTTARQELSTAYAASPTPVTLVWSGSSGSCTVTVKRVCDGKTVLSTTTSGTSVEFKDPEIGRNYVWTVKNGSTTVTGHFFTERVAPRIINATLGGIRNARDLGGWSAADGKVVKQGMVFRTREWDWVSNGYLDSYPKPYWRDTIGIKLDIDLRKRTAVNTSYHPTNDTAWALNKSPIDYSIPRYHVENDGASSFGGYGSLNGTSDRKCIYYYFQKFINSANYPIIIHCSHGKDRTGSLALVLSGLLGVSRSDMNLDWIYSWGENAAYTLTTDDKWALDNAYNAINNNYTGSTFADKCVAYIKKCYTDQGKTATQATTDIETFRALMLETPETAAVKPGDPEIVDEHDEVTYREYWWFRSNGGGTWPSTTGYFYTDATHKTKCLTAYGEGQHYPNDYDALAVLKPDNVAGYQHASPACGDVKIGKLITNGSKGLSCGIGNSPTFIMTNRTVATRTLWRHEAGVFTGDNMDFTLSGSGTGSIDIYANATIVGHDLLANTPKTIYVRFPAGKSDGATLVCDDNGTGSSNNTMKFGWFEGGQAGHTQRFVVTNSFMRFSHSSKTSKVAGALDFVFALGTNNLTTAATAPFGVTKTLVINAGSTLTVDAGGKSAGTYPLITAGTLTDNANLAASATVTGLKAGTTGSVAKSGNNINLVIANASSKTVVQVPTISTSSAVYTGAVQKPTFSPSSSNYTVNYGSGDYKAVGNYTITLTLLNTTDYIWSDSTSAARSYSYSITSGGEEPEPMPSTAFDAAHTIVCYGDSLTWGTSADKVTMDSRANYFDGRLAGATEVPQGYPYWLSSLVSNNYNVIHQSRGGAQTCNITSWSGEQQIKVKKAFTLPATGSVSVSTNFAFTSDCPWGEWGGWVYLSPKDQSKPRDQDVFNRWAGLVTPLYPLYESYDEAKTDCSITGTLGGRHVRLSGVHPTNITVTVFGSGTVQTIAADTPFIPDSTTVGPYTNAIRIICAGANDGSDNYTDRVKPLLQTFAAKGGKYLIVSPSVNTGTASPATSPTAIETDMATTFGDHYLNLRLKMETEGKTTASALGVPFTGKWTATDGTGLKAIDDSTHFSAKGYKVMAEFVRQKLEALGYLTDTPTPVPPPTPSTAFDSAHTIICYGDSLTEGLCASNLTYDARGNFHEGRLAGLTDTASYPYMLSGLVPNTYNVLKQSRSGSPAHQMTAWSGGSTVVVDRAFTLPAVGSVTIATNLVFQNCPWGKWGRWAGTGKDKAEKEDTFNRWAGFVTPIYPLMEAYDEAKTRYSVTGTLAGRRVRVQGLYPTNITVTVFGEGQETPVPVGSVLTLDNYELPFYSNAVRVVCGSGNDSYTNLASFVERVERYFDGFAALGGKYVIVSQECQTHDAKKGETQLQTKPTEIENYLADRYGAHHLNLRMAFVTNGMVTAKALGVVPQSSTETWDKALMYTDKTHLTSAGYVVMAEMVRRKLVALGYVEGDTPVPPGPTPTPGPVTTNAMANASWGYEIHGLGVASNEVALVFTNTTETMDWTLPGDVAQFRYLVVAGGGGGGGSTTGTNTAGGGGGAGGLRTGMAEVFDSRALAVKVGKGGTAGKGSANTATSTGAAGKGDASTLTLGAATVAAATGGGYGAKYNNTTTSSGGAGGSGGGGTFNTKAGGAGTDGEGFAGGYGGASYHGFGGGGGGAGGAGLPTDTSTASTGYHGGAGGDGLTSDITGAEVAYAGGGGGGAAQNGNGGAAGTGGAGGLGGGGKGGDATDNLRTGAAGRSGTGGGGGGAGRGSSANGGAGGSGVVVVRYATGASHAHVWGDWTTNVVATCLTNGIATRVCTAAGCTEPATVQTNVLAALGHAWGAWIVDVEPQIGVPGRRHHVCSRCQAEESETFEARPLRILTIGNSFSLKMVASNALPRAAALVGCPIDYAHFYRGGATLSEAWSYRGDVSKYSLSTCFTSAENPLDALTDTCITNVLKAMDWDVVTLQQGSASSYKSDTYSPYFQSLVSCIKALAPNAKIVWHMTWAYDRYSSKLSGWDFKGDVAQRDNMFDRIVGAYETNVVETAWKTIPTGYAIQLYRYGLPVLNPTDDFTNTDHQHLSVPGATDANPAGSYMQVLVWCRTLFGTMPSAEDYPPSAYSSKLSLPDADVARLRTCAADACAATDYRNYGQGTVDFSWSVTFKDDDGRVLSTLSVTNGACATAPTPEREGAILKGWTCKWPVVKSTGVGTETVTATSDEVATKKVYDNLVWTAAWETVLPDPGTLTTNAMANASWGYEIHGLGAASNEVALVFTNTTETMDWTIPDDVSSIWYLAVGGGGGGAGGSDGQAYGRGGGGAGGALMDEVAISSKSFSVSVGAGGAGMTAAQTKGNGKRGGNSTLNIGTDSIVAYGGGGGSSYSTGVGGSGYGCGGGGANSNVGGAGTEGQGYAGGKAGGNYCGGGGGGAGGVGSDSNSDHPGHGGSGVCSAITGGEVWYAGGGGGSKASNVEPKTRSTGGKGGGGRGGYANSATASAGEDASYYGGGGGGGHRVARGGNGYQGVVIVRYATGATPTPPVPPVGPRPVYDPTANTWTFEQDVTYGYATNAVYGASQAIFEENASLVITNGATVIVTNVSLGASGNVFDVREGGELQLTTKTAAQAAGKTWTFNLDGGSVGLYNTFDWNATDTIYLNLTNGAYFGGTASNTSGKLSDMEAAVWKVSLVDSTIKFNTYTLNAAGCSMKIDNTLVKGNGYFAIGGNAATLELAGESPCVQAATSLLTFGQNLTLTVKPEKSWSATEGVFQPHPSVTKYSTKVTIAAGVQYNVDVTELAGLTAAQTFCLVSYPASSDTQSSITLPAAAKVAVTGEGKDNFTAEFTKSSDNHCLYVTVAPKAAPYPSWIDSKDTTNQAKYAAWKTKFGVTNPDAPTTQEAYLLNCANTEAAVEAAKEAFKITSITILSDGTVEIGGPIAPDGGFNGQVEIRGAATIDGTYSTDTANPRFYRAYLIYLPGNGEK